MVKKINLINKTKLNSSLSGCTNGILNVNEDFNYYINPTKIKINNQNNDAKDLIKNRLNRKINLSKKETTISLSKQESISNILNNNSEMDFQNNFQSKNKLIKTPKIKEKKNNKIEKKKLNEEFNKIKEENEKLNFEFEKEKINYENLLIKIINESKKNFNFLICINPIQNSENQYNQII